MENALRRKLSVWLEWAFAGPKHTHSSLCKAVGIYSIIQRLLFARSLYEKGWTWWHRSYHDLWRLWHEFHQLRPMCARATWFSRSFLSRLRPQMKYNFSWSRKLYSQCSMSETKQITQICFWVRLVVKSEKRCSVGQGLPNVISGGDVMHPVGVF